MRIDFDFQPYEMPAWTSPGCDEEYTINGHQLAFPTGREDMGRS